MNDIFMLADAVEMWQRRYRSFGDYSVTTLLKPPRVVHLEKRHSHEVERTLDSLISAFMGTGVHSMFEENLRFKQVMEPRYDIERTVMDKIDDRIISGRFDVLWDGRHLYDFKSCKTWKKVFDPDMVEWHQQLNIYAHLLRNRGLDIQTINIIAIYMDWSRMMSMRGSGYPPAPVVEYRLSCWPDDVAKNFLHQRIELMKASEECSDEALPECTTEERWMRHDNGNPCVYAIITKEGATRALRVCDTEADAREFASTSKAVVPGTSWIEVRYAQAKRCEEFCAVNKFCTQYREYMDKKRTSNLTDKLPL
jgi:hypothetical protein